jgi:hypothetical protein
MAAENEEQRLKKERRLYKIHSEFQAEAHTGAILVIDGGITSLNPMDSVQNQVFVYNNIFYSYTENIGYKQDPSP